MRRSIVLFTLGLLAIAARPGFAQQGQFSAIQGRVVDDSEAVLPGVVVVVTHQASGIYRQVVSNSDGSYYIAGIVPGPYRVTADLQGFKKYERPDVVLQIGDRGLTFQRLTFDLRLALRVVGAL